MENNIENKRPTKEDYKEMLNRRINERGASLGSFFGNCDFNDFLKQVTENNDLQGLFKELFDKQINIVIEERTWDGEEAGLVKDIFDKAQKVFETIGEISYFEQQIQKIRKNN